MTAGNGAVTTVSVRQVAGTNSDGRQRSGDHDVGAAACDKCVGRHPKDDDPYDGRQWSGDNDVDAALQSLELQLPNNANEVTATDHCCAVRVFGPSKRVELWFHSPSALESFSQGFAGQESDDLQPWLRADIEAGIIHVSPALSTEYTPQLLNYDIAGLIDFKKGCYTGQEIVARMFYRGTAKKRLHLASCSHTIGSSSAVVYGDKEGDRGEILAYSNSDSDEHKLLAILPAEIDDSAQPLQLSDQADSVISILALPYCLE